MRLSLARENRMILYSLASAAAGGALGFAYYKFVGCRTGTCPITSSPYISTLYGALLGYLIAHGARM
jgi:hypothetical protein